MKIGIIQSAAQTADLSNNLRNLVQSYRDCIDRGAELVVAHAFALVGPQTKALKERRSFQQQALEALSLLAKELGDVPLIIAAFAEPYLDLEEEELLESTDATVVNTEELLTPFLLEDGLVNQLEDGEAAEILGLSIVTVVGDNYHMVEAEDFELLIRLSTKAWYYGGLSQEENERCWEAQMNRCPSITVIPSAYAEGYYYAGGSSLCNGTGVTSHRLPLFMASQAVITLNQATKAAPLPQEEEMLRHVITNSLREHLNNMDYSGVCLNLELQNSELLAILCAEAIGASKVHGVCFSDTDFKKEKKLGIKVQNMSELYNQVKMGPQQLLNKEVVSEFNQRAQASLISAYADQEGLMLLSPLNRHQILLGQYTLYADSCAKLLPFARLYDTDIHLLIKHLSEEAIDYFGVLGEPQQAKNDRILIATQDYNIGASELISLEGEELKENDVRYIQRRVFNAAEKAAQLPPYLHLENPKDNKQFPIHHKLND